MRRTLVLSFLIATTTLSAQNVIKDTVKIPEVSVEAKRITNTTREELDSTVLQNTVQKDLGEVLAQNANIFVKSYGLGSQATVSLRGSGSSHTNVLWNGVSLNSSMNGIVDFALFPSLFLDEVSIHYGNSSLQTASGGLGGAVNLGNKVQFRKKNQLSLQQLYGSFNFSTSAVKYEWGNDKIQTVSRLFYRTSDNNFSFKDFGEEGIPTREVENASLKQRSFMQSVYYRLKEKTTVEGHFWYYDSDRNLPPVITLRNLNESQTDESSRLMLQLKSYFKNGHYLLNATLLNDLIEYRNNRIRGTNSKTLSYKSWGEIEKKLKKTTLYSRLDFELNQAEHPSFTSQIQRERISSFASIKHQISKNLIAELAGRYEWIIDEDEYLLPLFSLAYHFNKSLTVSVQLSENLKYPSLNDLYWEFGGNPDLEAEENRSIEGGMSYKDDTETINYEVKASAYYSEINNYIQWQPTSFGYWQATNLKNVRIRGIESSLKVSQKDALLKKELTAHYTYTQSMNQTKQHEHDDSEGKQLIYIPEHQSNLQAELNYQSYRLFYQWQFVSARYTTTDNTDWQPHYQLSNLGFGKQFKGKKHTFNAEFSVLNLFDLEYHAIQWRPMPNRNYQLSLTYQFH